MLRGTARKRTALAGGITLVTGLATAVVGLSAGTALAAPTTLTYTCTGTVQSFTMTVSVAGAVTGTPKVGDPVTLDGFQVTLSGAEAQFSNPPVAQVTGTIQDLTVSANGAGAGSAAITNLPFDVQGDASGALSITVPAAPQSLSGFTATAEGPMTFSLPAEIVMPVQVFASSGLELDDFTLTCDTTDSTFASVDVAPADNGDGGTQTGGDGGDNGNTSPPPTQDNPTTSPPTSNNTNNTTDTTSARTLASTGAPYAIPLTGTGAALLLLGGGMLVAGRRRRGFAVEGPAEGPTSEEPGTRD